MSYASQYVSYWKKNHNSDISQIDDEWVVIHNNRGSSYPAWLCHTCDPKGRDLSISASIVNGDDLGSVRLTRKLMGKCHLCGVKPTPQLIAVYNLLTLFEGA